MHELARLMQMMHQIAYCAFLADPDDVRTFSVTLGTARSVVHRLAVRQSGVQTSIAFVYSNGVLQHVSFDLVHG